VGLAQTTTDFENRLELSYSQSNGLSFVGSRSCDCIENANIGEKLLNREAVRSAALNGIRPRLEVHPHRVRMFEVAALPAPIRSTVYETRWNLLVDISAFLDLNPTLVADNREASIKWGSGQAGNWPRAPFSNSISALTKSSPGAGKICDAVRAVT
jgi:hypothetical protein